MRPKYYTFFILASIIIISYAEFRILWIIISQNIGFTLQESLAPLSGTPRWRANQNRLLSGAIVKAIRIMSGTESITAYQIFGLASLTLTNIVAYFMLKKNILHLVAFVAAFILLQDASYFNTWDFIDLLIFTTLAYGIVSEQKLMFFVLIFAVDIFNRESALFIPVWLCIDSFRRDWKTFFVGIALIIIGVLTVYFLRETLFIQSSVVGNDDANRLIGNHFCLPINIQRIFMSRSLGDLNLIEFVPFIALGWIVYANWRKRLTLLIVLITGANLLFAHINEMRVWLILIPLYFAVYGITSSKTM